MVDVDLFGQAIGEDQAHYPETPGYKGPAETGKEAAEAIAPMTGRYRLLALAAVAHAGSRGLTADELADALDVSRWTIQPRTSELRALGKIADSGQRRRNTTGKNAIVWTLPQFAAGEGGTA